MIARLCLLALVAGCSPDIARSHSSRTTDLSQRAYAAAVACGLRERDIELVGKADRRTFVVQPSAMQVPGTAFICFLNWARENGATVGFISEPPPENR